MNFLIVAIDHAMQFVPVEGDVPQMGATKARLERMVRDALATRGVQLICEESDPRHLSVAQKIAYEHEPRIPWKNIVMTAQERLEAGIWEALLHRPFHVIFHDDGTGNTIEHRIPQDDIREQFFVDQAIQAANACRANSILVLCGDMHVEALKVKLEASGHQGDTNRELVPEKRWE